MKKKGNLAALTEGAVCVALAFILGFVKIPTGGFGGSISLVMVPLIVFALRRGGVWGLGAGLVYGVIDFFEGGGFSITWQSMLLDYFFAYMLVGLAGFFPKKPVLGALVGCLARYVCLVFSGVFIWGEYMSDIEIFGATLPMSRVWIYSLVYNAQYMLPAIIITLIVIAIFAARTDIVKNQRLRGKNS
ncbi:MAG: energy-coupled thiamine transporter ThiT [Oscillospiraceae bacterium]|jgi:thiamine transporter|nr:energy-coupled thiamine transporter ThiT [Oscillospiraceae bacterium]